MDYLYSSSSSLAQQPLSVKACLYPLLMKWAWLSVTYCYHRRIVSPTQGLFGTWTHDGHAVTSIDQSPEYFFNSNRNIQETNALNGQQIFDLQVEKQRNVIKNELLLSSKRSDQMAPDWHSHLISTWYLFAFLHLTLLSWGPHWKEGSYFLLSVSLLLPFFAHFTFGRLRRSFSGAPGHVSMF